MAAALAAAVLVGVVSAAAGSNTSPAAVAKSRCHFVVKKGKKVRTCAKAKSKPKPASSRVVAAKQLVAGITGAKTPSARYQAVVGVMRALHVGVVSAKGKPVVVSPEPDAARLFQLYDFEVRGLAEQVARGRTMSLDDLAAALKKGGIGLDDTRPLPAALLAEALHDATQAALAKPKLDSSLLPLVVRDLGLRRGFDTSKDLDPNKVRLDPLQAWLITADIALPVLREVPLPQARALAAVSDLPSACVQYKDAAEALSNKIENGVGGKLQKWIADEAVGHIYDKIADRLAREATRWAIKNLPRWAVRGAYEVGKAASVAVPIIDLIHGALLANSIDVRSLEDSLPPIHWWHSVSEGTTLTFRTKVTMLDDYGDTAVKCGDLLGFTVPPKGGVKDVWVNWEQAQGDLKGQGKLDCTSVPVIGACVSKTGGDGIARLVFTPKIESFPGFGMEREASGVIDGTALYQTALGGGVAGGIAQFLTPKYGSTRWFVRSHRPRGFTFSTPRDYPPAPTTEGANEAYAVDAHVCGSSPYTTAWSGTLHQLIMGAAAPFPDKPLPLSNWLFTNGSGSSPPGREITYYNGKLVSGRFEAKLLPGPPAQVQVQIVDDYPFNGGPVLRTVTVPLQEDTTCPDNS